MTDNVIEKIVERIDWSTVKNSVQLRLNNAQLTSVDMMTTKSYIRSIVESALSIYVDNQFRHRFKIGISPVSKKLCKIQLSYGDKLLVDWDLTLDESLF